MPNTLIILGRDPEGFSDEDMVGCICLNKEDFDIWFNFWINLKIIDSWFKFIASLFEDTLSTCSWVMSL